MAKAISNTSTNITQAEMRESELGVVGDFLVKVKDLTHLNKVMSAMKLVKGISGVKRRDFISPNHLD
jgi:GTP pyrophosphokinase